MEQKEVAKIINNFLGGLADGEIIVLAPFRRDCWKIFSQANADIRTYELMDAVKELFDAQATKANFKLKLLAQFTYMWGEWSYAREMLGTE